MKQNTIQHYYVNEEKTHKNTILEFIDGDQFDKVLGKITNGLFKAIVFFGVPFFLYVIFQFLKMS
ncbi:hypothetical protein [Fredinandcohnia sp. 179-A 10B2 NHS]|uniref:hypothetical protein n=1 Tax=Fredinandcohnia sp. 179-A 10B2 NHS TaxID=3235176 RepID=UPI0039A3913B